MALLSKDPEACVVSLAELVGIAHAIETEAVRRYTWLAGEMDRRGEEETAETFRALAAEEGRHIAALGGWAAGLGETLPPPGSFSWRLPPDLAKTWEEAEASTLLTPFRALAIAVDNEQRAFAFFSYLAARADDPKLATEAEALAQQELRHAALLRTWRRAAWHRDRGAASTKFGPIKNRNELVALIAEHERAIARCHRTLAYRLAELEDEKSAALLAELADLAEVRATPFNSEPSPLDLDEVRTALLLLRAAETPLESLSESLETVLRAPPDEETQGEAQDALAHVVARIARIGRRIEMLENG